MSTLIGATDELCGASPIAISFTSTCGCLAHVVGGIEIFPGHLPQRRIAGQACAVDVQIELLFRFRRIHDGESQELAVWSERSEHVERIGRAA